MSDNEEFDIDEEILKISRKTRANVMRSEMSFENQLKKLDAEIESASKNKIKDFDKIKKTTRDYLEMDFDTSYIDRYRNRLKRI